MGTSSNPLSGPAVHFVIPCFAMQVLIPIKLGSRNEIRNDMELPFASSHVGDDFAMRTFQITLRVKNSASSMHTQWSERSILRNKSGNCNLDN